MRISKVGGPISRHTGERSDPGGHPEERSDEGSLSFEAVVTTLARKRSLVASLLRMTRRGLALRMTRRGLAPQDDDQGAVSPGNSRPNQHCPAIRRAPHPPILRRQPRRTRENLDALDIN